MTPHSQGSTRCLGLHANPVLLIDSIRSKEPATISPAENTALLCMHPPITAQRKHAHKTPPPKPNPTTACQTEQINCFQVLLLISICYCSLPLSSAGTCQQTSGNCRQRLKEIYSEELNMEKNGIHLPALRRLGRRQQMENIVSTSFGPGHCISILIVFLTDVQEFL